MNLYEVKSGKNAKEADWCASALENLKTCKAFLKVKLYFQEPWKWWRVLHFSSLGHVLNENTEIKHSPQFQLDVIRAHLISPVNCYVLQLVLIWFVLLKHSLEVVRKVSTLTCILYGSQMSDLLIWTLELQIDIKDTSRT